MPLSEPGHGRLNGETPGKQAGSDRTRDEPERAIGRSRLPGSTILREVLLMKTFTAIIEKCPDTGYFVGHIPGFPGAHSQGETIEELSANLKEVVALLLEDGEPAMEAEFVGTATVQVG